MAIIDNKVLNAHVTYLHAIQERTEFYRTAKNILELSVPERAAQGKREQEIYKKCADLRREYKTVKACQLWWVTYRNPDDERIDHSVHISYKRARDTMRYLERCGLTHLNILGRCVEYEKN